MDALAVIQDFYDHFPLSLRAVLILSGIFFIGLVLAWREFWAWYCKISALRAEVQALRAQLTRIELMLQLPQQAPSAPTPAAEQIALELSRDSKQSAFPLNH